jgi:CheY-like chemotaxis protein
VDLSGQEILVVDDVKFTRAMLVRMLQGLGCNTVHEAGDGHEALALLKLRHQRIGCVITDLEMPGLDGLGLLQAIRVGTADIPRNLRVVLFTGNSDFERLGAALLLDLDAFLPKPASRQGLEHCLVRLLGKHAPDNAGDLVAAAEIYRAVDLGLQPQAVVSSEGPAAAAGQSERRLPLAELPDGAVLSRDLLFGNGRLLLPAGTRLSARSRQRLAELIPLANLAAEAWLVE